MPKWLILLKIKCCHYSSFTVQPKILSVTWCICFENVLVNGESENLTFEIKIVLNRSSFEEYVILTHLLKDAHEFFSQGFARRALLQISTFFLFWTYAPM